VVQLISNYVIDRVRTIIGRPRLYCTKVHARSQKRLNTYTPVAIHPTPISDFRLQSSYCFEIKMKRPLGLPSSGKIFAISQSSNLMGVLSLGTVHTENLHL